MLTCVPQFKRVLALALAILVACFSTSAAQGTGRSMDIDLSIRSAAMGGTTTAVFWGTDSDHWGNPATLGYVRGIRYEWGRTQLVPGLANDVLLTSHVLKAGGSGVGFAFSGAPFGAGSVRLDYGQSQGSDPSGNPTGLFNSYEQVDSWSLGVSAIELVRTLISLGDGVPSPLLRRVEISGGMSFKDIEINLAPASAGGTARTSARDLGVLVRVTPVDRLEAAQGLPLRIDVSVGHSRLNYNDDAIVTFINASQASRVTRHRRTGFAARVSVDPPGLHHVVTESTTRDALARGLSPFFSFAIARDHAKMDAGEGRNVFETDGTGLELAIANVLAVRRGNFRDRIGDIDGTTFGWSLGLPFGPWGAVRYEQAAFPQARDSGLDDVTRRAVTAWADPVAIWRSLAARR